MNSKSANKPIIVFLKNQATGQRIRLGEYSSKTIKLGDVVAGASVGIDSWIPEGKVASLLYLRNRVPLDEWSGCSLGSFLGSDAANGGSFLITLIVEDSSLTPMPRSAVPETTVISNGKKKENISMESALQLILRGPVSTRDPCLSTLLKYIEALLKFDMKGSDKYEKVRRINISNSSFVSKVGSVRGGVEFLVAIGFTRDEQALVLLPQNESHHWNLHSKALLEDALKPKSNNTPLPVTHQSNALSSTAMKKSEDNACLPNNFNPYNSHNFNMQAVATGGKVNPNNIIPDGKYDSKIERDLKKLQDQAAMIQLKNERKPLDRMLVAFEPGGLEIPLNSTIDVSESKADGKLFAEKLQRQEETRKKQEAGFTTKAMRDLARMKKAKVYPHTQLRISFPNGHSLSCRFLPSEKILNVKEVVKSTLLEIFRKEPFDLYVSPPRKVLSDDSTLDQEQLVPAAKIHVSWKSTNMASISPDQQIIDQSYYKFDSLNKSAYPGSKSVADELAAAEAQKRSSDGKIKKKQNEEELIARMMGKPTSMSSKLSSSSSKKSSLPKWFK